MRVLVLSDIHGNLHALQAVLADAAPFDQLWNLGDAVGYGAFPNEVLDLIRPLAQVNVRGNHDRVCCGLSDSYGFNPVAGQAAAWTRAHLTADNRDWLRAVPQGPIQVSPTVLCVHGSPLNEDQYIVTMRDAWMPLQRMGAEVAFFGHTHLQGAFSQWAEQWEEIRPGLEGSDIPERLTFDLPPGSRHLINPGSVGQPRDGDWRAAFALYDDVAGHVTFCRVPYDLPAAQSAIREAGLPDRLASRLAAGR